MASHWRQRVGSDLPGSRRLIETEQLTEAKCLRLLASIRVGRIALTRHALPVVIPVSFALDGRDIVIPTAPNSLLAASGDDVVVAFETGELDPDTGSGWSVLVTGTTRAISDPHPISGVRQLGLDPRLGDDGSRFVRVSPGLISGSRLERRSGQPEPALA